MVFRFHKVINAPPPPFPFYSIPISVQIVSSAQVEMGLPFCSICSLTNSAKPLSCISSINQTYSYKPHQKWIYANTQEETQHICWKIHVVYSALTLKARNPEWRTLIKINSSICCIVSSLIKTVWHGSAESAVFVADCMRRCLNCTQPWHYSLQLHCSWKHKASAAIIGSWWVLTRETQQNKYVNKDVFWTPKGEGKGLHLSLFKNDYPVTIPPKLKWSFFSLKVNKWQEWDLQPGFSVSQFSSTNH